MSIKQPKTILQLILGGFTIAIVPLVVALLIAQSSVQQMTDTGQSTVVRATESVQAARSLVDHITSMERTLRQFLALNDSELLVAYTNSREQFLDDIAVIEALFSNEEILLLTGIIRKEEKPLSEIVSQRPVDLVALENEIDRFGNMISFGRGVLFEVSRQISDEIKRMQASATETQRAIFWLIAALIPTVLGLTALFITLIVKPLRQVDHSIRRIGQGEFKTPVKINGPHDLVELGDRLESMRLRLLEVENQKIQFLRHVSHELKTPLTAILEGADLLASGASGRLQEEQSEIVGLISSNSERLHRQIEDLLSFSMMQNRRAHMELSRIALDNLIRRIVDNYQMSSKTRQLHFDLNLESVILTGDKEKLTAIINNLVSNAVKYSPTQGIITIKLAIEEDLAIMDIRDQGPGIERDEIERIFEPFYQGGAFHDSHVKGSGIGLSITRQNAALHKGQINVIQSSHGAHFRLLLPLDKLSTVSSNQAEG